MSEFFCDRLRSSASSASPSIPDPELRAKMEDVFDDTEDTREEEGDKENNVTEEEDTEKVEQLQAEIESLQVFYFFLRRFLAPTGTLKKSQSSSVRSKLV